LTTVFRTIEKCLSVMTVAKVLLQCAQKLNI